MAAVVGGVGYALGARQWWNAYRAIRSLMLGGVSPRMLVVLALLVCLGLVALLVVG